MLSSGGASTRHAYSINEERAPARGDVRQRNRYATASTATGDDAEAYRRRCFTLPQASTCARHAYAGSGRHHGGRVIRRCRTQREAVYLLAHAQLSTQTTSHI